MRKAMIASLFAPLMLAGFAGAAGICGDVNDSGNVSSTDALLVLRKGVGQDVELQCGAAAQALTTGQTQSFGAGSDGDLEQGVPRSFTDNGDGTVTDAATGLMWEKKDQSGGIHDWGNTYTWTAGTNAFNGTVALTFLATLNASTFAGYDDWRLPNLRELATLPNYDVLEPAAFDAFHDGCEPGCSVLTCSCTAPDGHWTSTTSLEDDSEAWRVHFFAGGVGAVAKSTALAARAVRGPF
ncbi:MAG TPA: DUF1566 domain-containing protein [Candidatus Binatia bacterium]|nr:DUF1566 domain-containing protein [Candidatus Binatia bacterium]